MNADPPMASAGAGPPHAVAGADPRHTVGSARLRRAALSAGSPQAGATIVTQTRVLPGADAEFAQFQARISAAITALPGFVEQSVLPPDPPVQVDWVILQRFRTVEQAATWLRSAQRLKMLAEIQPILSGLDDVHLVRDMHEGALPSPVSAVITTRVKPDREAEYRQWEHRIAAAQAQSPGFQGYRFEPPIPGVQDNYLAILRFENEAALDGWMNSPRRQALLAEAGPLTDAVHSRIVRSAFTQWFAPVGQGGEPAAERAQPPAWKQNMIVLLLLYPVVFLFGTFVQTPVLGRAWGLPFYFSLFVGNVASVVILNYLVPPVVRAFGWWLGAGTARRATNLGGAGLLLLGYALTLFCFSRF